MRYRFWIGRAFRTPENQDEEPELRRLLEAWRKRNPSLPEAIITTGAPMFWDPSKQWICFADLAVRVKHKTGFIIHPDAFYGINNTLDPYIAQGIDSGVYCMLVQPLVDLGEG